MAKDKKSFILYADLITVVTKLVLKDRENKTNYAGELFLTILEFVNDKEPIPVDFIVEMAFEPIKLSLKRDLKKYETYIEKQKANGKKGGRPKKTEITQPLIKEPKKADSVNVSDNVNDNTIVIEGLPTFEQHKDIKPLNNNLTEELFLKRWCDARTHYDHLPTNIKKLTQFEKIDFNELKQDYDLKDFERAMQGLFQQKTYPKTRLRPSHFLKREHFETYLTCFTTQEKLFDNNKYKKTVERL